MSKLYKLLMAMALGLSFVPSEESQAGYPLRQKTRNRLMKKKRAEKPSQNLENKNTNSDEEQVAVTSKNIKNIVEQLRKEVSALTKKLASYDKILDDTAEVVNNHKGSTAFAPIPHQP